MRWLAVAFALLAELVLSATVQAHEMRPGFLDMREIAANHFAVIWKVPAIGDMRLALYVKLPEACQADNPPVISFENNYALSRWQASCATGLAGQTIAVDGLRTTLTDVLARVEYLDGATQVERLTPDRIEFVAKGTMTWEDNAWTYFVLGVSHILSGFDHLLFVLALILLINDRWMLLKTVTAFTLAHSITLAGSTLGYLSLPQKPVEATIALSIAFVASEILKMKPGERRLSEAYPWLVSFTFGLLHGFGFAGALKEIGLPHSDVPLALLTFNLGVEAGQLLFIAGILTAIWALSALIKQRAALARLAAAYMIGIAAAVWLVMRVANFWV